MRLARPPYTYYPDSREAAMLWYHDHTMGINRLMAGNRDAPWVPDVTGSLILVNGRLFPYLDVTPPK